MLQIPTDASLNEITFNNDTYLNFMIRSIDKILICTDRKIILRGHPLSRHQDKVLPFLLNHYSESKRVFNSNQVDLEDDFKNKSTASTCSTISIFKITSNLSFAL